MAAPANECTNLHRNEDGEYEDPITLEPIAPERLVHLPAGRFQYCYDAFELLRYIVSEHQARRKPTLPDTRAVLTLYGIEEVRRVARLSFPQLYKVVGLPRGREQIFAVENDARNYSNARAGSSYFSFADVADPIVEDMLYPDGIEETPADPFPGPYIDEAAVAARSSRERREDEEARARRAREAQEQAERPVRVEEPEAEEGIPQGEMLIEGEEARFDFQGEFARRMALAGEELDLEEREVQAEGQADPRQPRAGEFEVGNKLAVQVRPGEWRCGPREAIYDEREMDARFPMNNPYNIKIDSYCPVAELQELRALGHEVHDPHEEWALGVTLDVDGEAVLLHEDWGTPSCSSGGDRRNNDPCRPDLIEEIAARRPRRYLRMLGEENVGHEIEYRFDRPSQSLRCKDLDNPEGEESDCTEEMRNELGWHPVASDPDVISRRLTLRGPIDCATKQEWHAARASGQPIPWRECTEDQRVYLRQLPEDQGEFFRDLESGRYADELEAEDAAREARDGGQEFDEDE